MRAGSPSPLKDSSKLNLGFPICIYPGQICLPYRRLLVEKSIMSPEFRFEPLGQSWVAFHPQPQGIIRFIGGTFFGSFPTLFYRYFLKKLFEAGYTIIAIPFRFTFDHWSVAISLLGTQNDLVDILIAAAENRGYDSQVYTTASNYFWIGHSLGCKYIALLEVLSTADKHSNIAECADEKTSQQVAERLGQQRTIFNQPSVLIAPNIADTKSAIPIPAVAYLLDSLGWGVLPNRHQTRCLIRTSNLFNLTALIAFEQDDISGNVDRENLDVYWLIHTLGYKNLIYQELLGKHLEPVGIQLGKYIVDLNPWDKFIALIVYRHLERVTVQFLEKLSIRIW